jgi:hypothetical protein
MINVLDLLKNNNSTVRRAGQHFTSACPGCGGDKKTSQRFHVWPQDNNGTGRYHCFACGCHGDNIQFLRDFKSMTYGQACRELNIEIKKSGLTASGLYPDPPRHDGGFSPRQTSAPEAQWQDRAVEFCATAFEALFKNEEQLDWLLKKRGIDRATARRFCLGWNAQDVYRPRDSWGLPPGGISERTGKPKELWVPPGLVIPHVISDHRIMNIRIRKGPGDYYIVPGGTVFPLMVPAPGKHKIYVIVETHLDAMMIARFAGDLVGVVAAGSTTVRPNAAQYRILHEAACIMVATDNDGEPGARAWRWWQAQFPKTALRCPVAIGKDPGDAFEQGEDIRAWILEAGPEIFSAANVQSEKNAPEKSETAPDSLRELYDLVCKYRLQLISRPDKTSIAGGYDKAPFNDSRRIQQLVFCDDHVFEFLNARQGVEINRGNFWR